jgi:hypothetical protein
MPTCTALATIRFSTILPLVRYEGWIYLLNIYLYYSLSLYQYAFIHQTDVNIFVRFCFTPPSDSGPPPAHRAHKCVWLIASRGCESENIERWPESFEFTLDSVSETSSPATGLHPNDLHHSHNLLNCCLQAWYTKLKREMHSTKLQLAH